MRNYAYRPPWLLKMKAVFPFETLGMGALLFSAKGAEISTPCGMQGAGFEPRWGQEILFSPHPSRLAMGPTQPPVQWVPGFFPGGKGSGAWLWPPTPYCVEVKNE